MTLAINDMVEITMNETTNIFRVQKISRAGSSTQLTLRKHTDATTDKNEHYILKTVPTLIDEYKMQKVTINRLGKRL
ncbi:MAG: hypothetical protein IE914_10745 [Thiotrichales bacterium]|nr:hypothetical protein [Thiotrichales bacterium]